MLEDTSLSIDGWVVSKWCEIILRPLTVEVLLFSTEPLKEFRKAPPRHSNYICDPILQSHCIFKRGLPVAYLPIKNLLSTIFTVSDLMKFTQTSIPN